MLAFCFFILSQHKINGSHFAIDFRINRLLSRDRARAEICSRESEENDRKLEEVSARIAKAEEKAKAVAERDKTAKELERTRQNRQELEAALESERSRQPKLKELGSEIAMINAEVPEYGKISRLNEALMKDRQTVSSYKGAESWKYQN